MTESIADIPRNIFRSSPYMIYGAGLLSSLISSNPIGAQFSVLSILFSDVLNHCLKKLLAEHYPDNEDLKRPNPPPDGCGIFGNCTTKDNSVGIVSGHAQAIGFAVVFWLMYIWAVNKNTNQSIMITITIIIIALVILRSRITEGCHTVKQLIYGFSLGSVLGYMCYKLINIV
jgi:membrane-associated phospholipid phosphatase